VSVVPLTAAIDAEHGGRWTSLRGGGREWLWQRDEPRRSCVRPGDAFADAGGLEECLPTVRGVPDHGDVWTRRWTAVDKTTHTIRTADFELTRNIHAGDSLAADYLLTAEPGFRQGKHPHGLLVYRKARTPAVGIPPTAPGWLRRRARDHETARRSYPNG